MKIQVDRSGGFAGIRQQAVIDTDQLDPKERQELQGLLESSDFFNPSLGPVSAQAAPDRFHYSITVEDGPRRRTVELDEGSVPEQWQALVQRVNALARRYRRQ